MTSIPFISLDERSLAPIYRQIYDEIRRAILTGQFESGLRLPASRLLAEQLGVSRMTVMSAYDQLFAEGYLEGKVGSGTYVASHLPEDFLQIAGQEKKGFRSKRIARRIKLSNYGEYLRDRIGLISRNHGATEFVPFQHGLTAIDKFPFEVWSKIAQRHLKYTQSATLGYGESGGLRPLREAIAEHLRSARGVKCESEQVIVTNGAQQALDMISRVLLTPQDKILMEDPGYLGARDILAGSTAEIVAIPIDAEGIDLKRASHLRNLRLAYVTPSHQFPLGGTMSLSRRLQLLEWARDREAWIIEDDYDSEFRYAGRPLASLQGLDRDGRVIYVGTFSKTIYPSLRLGCVVVPPDLVDIFTAARALSDLHSPLIDQSILAEFIAEGHYARHLRRMRTLYASRQEVLLAETERYLKGLLEIAKADAGMHLIGWLPAGVDDQNVSRQLRREAFGRLPYRDIASRSQKEVASCLATRRSMKSKFVPVPEFCTTYWKDLNDVLLNPAKTVPYQVKPGPNTSDPQQEIQDGSKDRIKLSPVWKKQPNDPKNKAYEMRRNRQEKSRYAGGDPNHPHLLIIIGHAADKIRCPDQHRHQKEHCSRNNTGSDPKFRMRF
jgi:GntR family transcriptional regulator/MocR family aminotransferase